MFQTWFPQGFGYGDTKLPGYCEGELFTDGQWSPLMYAVSTSKNLEIIDALIEAKEYIGPSMNVNDLFFSSNGQ